MKRIKDIADKTELDINNNENLMKYDSGRTALMIACINGVTNMVELLLKPRHKAIVNYQMNC